MAKLWRDDLCGLLLQYLKEKTNIMESKFNIEK